MCTRHEPAAKAPRRGNAGAALVIALAASAVVALSVALLLGYINRMTVEQARREIMAQARLSQASAGDMIGALLASGRVPFTDGDGFLELAGQTTRISCESATELPPVRIDLATGDELDGFTPVESSGSIVLAGVRGGRLEVWEFDQRTGEPLSRSPITVCEASGGWLAAGFGRGSGRLVAAASEGPSGVTASLVGVDGSVVSVATGLSSLEGCTRAEAGTAGGQPVLVLSGAGGSRVFFFTSGEAVEIPSPPGTCPVVTRGAIWPAGALADAAGSGAHVQVLDVLRGDWDADGSEDVCWIARDRVTVLLSSSGALLCDSCPGAGPGAWGDLGGAIGLAVRWSTPAGITAWRTFAAGRFSNLAGGGALTLPWEGRLTGGCGFVAGVMDGKAELYTSAGRPLTALGGSLEAVVDIDGGAADFILQSEDGWSAVLDPADGPGEAHTWSLTTLDKDGGRVLSGRVTFSVFRSASGGARLYREDES
ncbi:hypothetical protein GX411_04215 [Candidatus Fermentibacteria bacterium]|nr:hypothetical protein [Candidatus Fermentibacteria bacterium]